MITFIQKHCSKEWQEYIAHHKQTIRIEKGELILQAGEKTKGIYIIDAGKVKITYKQFNGSHLLIRLAGEGDILGHRGFGGNWTYPISALSLEDTSLTLIPTDIFINVTKTNPDFSYHLMMFFAEELRKSEARIKHYPVRNLVALALYENYNAYGFEANSKKLSFTLSRKDIASKAGTTYESVIRNLADLNQEKIIKIDGKAIHILNLTKLKSLAEPPYKK
jgi:CRP/FNR family transcriptional regulator, polysaccharide utilization system transcription regulator